MKLFLFLIFISIYTTGFSNNLTISNLVLNQAAQEVRFDISWNNSWRFDGVATPQNWDAVWVFVKFRGCEGCVQSLEWIHGTIDGPNSNFGNLQAHSTHTGNQYYTDRLGVMLRRSTTGLFPNQAASSITLRVDNMPTSGSLEMRIVGIEMVYIPSGAYQLGDGNSTTTSRFHLGASTTSTYTVANENAITFSNTAGNLFATGSTPCCAGSYVIPASFPKGFAGFYIMKYEITQGQYATFLNTILPTQAAARYTANYNTNRNRLRNNGASPNVYYSERPDRAQNFLSPNDIMAYLDWAALRPLSEMEYEKAARGIIAAVPNEYAWGSIVLNQAQVISPSANENGTETISTTTNANCAYSFWAFTGGDFAVSANFNDQQGPLRVGIFADPFDGSRNATGASYYGVMELSGNIYEMTIGIIDIQAAPIFDSRFGDGYLGLNALHNVTNWPSALGFENHIMYRGGSWASFGNNLIRISNRQTITNALDSRTNENGGRGGR